MVTSLAGIAAIPGGALWELLSLMLLKNNFYMSNRDSFGYFYSLVNYCS
jgi:hypothetical protein